MPDSSAYHETRSTASPHEVSFQDYHGVPGPEPYPFSSYCKQPHSELIVPPNWPIECKGECLSLKDLLATKD